MNETILTKNDKSYLIQLSDGEYDKYGNFTPSGLKTEDPMVIHIALKEIENLIEEIQNLKITIQEAYITTKYFTMGYRERDMKHVNVYGEVKILNQHTQIERGSTE